MRGGGPISVFNGSLYSNQSKMRGGFRIGNWLTTPIKRIAGFVKGAAKLAASGGGVLQNIGDGLKDGNLKDKMRQTIMTNVAPRAARAAVDVTKKVLAGDSIGSAIKSTLNKQKEELIKKAKDTLHISDKPNKKRSVQKSGSPAAKVRKKGKKSAGERYTDVFSRLKNK